MGYFVSTASAVRKRIPGVLPASRKTLTPGSRLKERGLRFYNPAIGRWLSRDPIGEEGGLNRYGFVENDPANHRDVLGLVSGTFDGSYDENGGPPGWYAWTPAMLTENICPCAQRTGTCKWTMSCTLSLSYSMHFAAEDNEVWTSEPGALPSEPSTQGWNTWTFNRKWGWVLRHEIRHVKHYRQWWNKRRGELQTEEAADYETQTACDTKASQVVSASQSSFQSMYNNECSHGGW